MKINYKIKFRNFRDYMELRNILSSRDTLLENHNANYFDWTKILYTDLIILGIILLLNILLNGSLVLLFFLIFSMSVTIAIFVMFLLFYLRYLKLRKYRYGKLLIDEDGIIDISDYGYICGFTWDQLSLIVKGRFDTVIFSDFAFSLYINNDVSDEVVEKIKKYKKDLVFIDRSVIKKKK